MNFLSSLQHKDKLCTFLPIGQRVKGKTKNSFTPLKLNFTFYRMKRLVIVVNEIKYQKHTKERGYRQVQDTVLHSLITNSTYRTICRKGISMQTLNNLE